jgi:hypothetical protein
MDVHNGDVNSHSVCCRGVEGVDRNGSSRYLNCTKAKLSREWQDRMLNTRLHMSKYLKQLNSPSYKVIKEAKSMRPESFVVRQPWARSDDLEGEFCAPITVITSSAFSLRAEPQQHLSHDLMSTTSSRNACFLSRKIMLR